MNSPLVQCPKCRGFLLEGVFNRQDLVPCPLCETLLEVEVFPAFFRRINPGKNAEALIVEGESSCFYHPEKKAVVPCGGCGRFLCALCDCELNGQHLCPSCLEAGRTKGKIKEAPRKSARVRYDRIALATVVFPYCYRFTWPPLSPPPIGDIYLHSLLECAPQRCAPHQDSLYVIAIAIRRSCNSPGWIAVLDLCP